MVFEKMIPKKTRTPVPTKLVSTLHFPWTALILVNPCWQRGGNFETTHSVCSKLILICLPVSETTTTTRSMIKNVLSLGKNLLTLTHTHTHTHTHTYAYRTEHAGPHCYRRYLNHGICHADEDEEPRCVQLTNQHKGAIRFIRKVSTPQPARTFPFPPHSVLPHCML